MDVGEYIKELRISKRLTQEDLGKIVGVQRAAVQKWESGMTQNLKRVTIQILADYFCVSPASFFSSKNIKNAFNDLDENEQSLITNYRTLSDQGKEYILQTMNLAINTYKKDTSTANTKKQIS